MSDFSKYDEAQAAEKAAEQALVFQINITNTNGGSNAADQAKIDAEVVEAVSRTKFMTDALASVPPVGTTLPDGTVSGFRTDSGLAQRNQSGITGYDGSNIGQRKLDGTFAQGQSAPQGPFPQRLANGQVIQNDKTFTGSTPVQGAPGYNGPVAPGDSNFPNGQTSNGQSVNGPNYNGQYGYSGQGYPNGAVTGVSLSPATVASGSGEFTLQVVGQGFDKTSFVRWNGQNRKTTLIDATHLSAVITAADLVHKGEANVQVVNPTASAAQSGVMAFTIS